jgi:hypothetical protein
MNDKRLENKSSNNRGIINGQIRNVSYESKPMEFRWRDFCILIGWLGFIMLLISFCKYLFNIT